MPDPQNLTMAGVVAGVLILEMRLLRRELKIAMAAIVERSRRRDNRQRRRESMQPPVRRNTPHGTPIQTPSHESWDDDSTDLHELMERERERQRHRPHRPGERPPRPGTHHDRDD